MRKPVHAGEDQSQVRFDLAYTMPDAEELWTVGLYPDPHYKELKTKIAEFRNVHPDQIVLAGGSSELIHAIVRAVYRRALESSKYPHLVGVVEFPTYLEYAYAMTLWNYKVQVSMSRVPYSQGPEADLYFWCNPNNPTGEYTSTGVLWSLAGPGLLVVDEAYLFQSGFLDMSATRYLQDWNDHLVVMGTLSKDLSIPGARVGYAIFAPNSRLQSYVQDQIPSWPISGISMQYSLVRLEHLEVSEDRNLSAVKRAKELRLKCMEMGFDSYGASDTAFFLLEMAPAVEQTLKSEYGIRVRRCSDYGLPRYVRIVSRTEESDQALLEALEVVSNAMPKVWGIETP